MTPPTKPKKFSIVPGERTQADGPALGHGKLEILGLVAEGLTNVQIAKRLFLSKNTVRQHLRAPYKVLGVKNHTEAAQLFQRGTRKNGLHIVSCGPDHVSAGHCERA